MSLANLSLIYHLGLLNTPLDDDRTAFAGGTLQANAAPILGEFTRFTIAKDATGGVGTVTNRNSAVLKSILTGDAATWTFIVNDSPNYIQVFCAPGENMNGVLNASFAIPPGQSGSFLRVPNHIATAGPDWRPSLIA
jgi:hypothetical protein